MPAAPHAIDPTTRSLRRHRPSRVLGKRLRVQPAEAEAALPLMSERQLIYRGNEPAPGRFLQTGDVVNPWVQAGLNFPPIPRHVNDAWSGPAIEVKSASELAATIGRVGQELDSRSVQIVVEAKTGCVRADAGKDPPPPLAGAEAMAAGLVRQYIASSREARRQARDGEANGHAPRVIAGPGAGT